MTARESYEALDGHKDFATYEAGWKARIPPELEAQGKEMVRLLRENKDYQMRRSQILRFIEAVAGEQIDAQDGMVPSLSRDQI